MSSRYLVICLGEFHQISRKSNSSVQNSSFESQSLFIKRSTIVAQTVPIIQISMSLLDIAIFSIVFSPYADASKIGRQAGSISDHNSQ